MKNLNTMTNEELAISYMEGNNRAFDMLLQRTQDALFTYILFVVHDNDTANDIFQETFVKAIMYLQKGRYTPTGKFSAWMMRIAHNAIMDWYRRNNHKTRISLNQVYGTNITTLESLGPSCYDMELPTYCPNYLIFMQGETLSDKDEWMGLNSVTFRDIRAGKLYRDTYEDGKYIIDNERMTSDFPNIGLLMNLYDTFITEHDRVLRIKV